VTATDSPGGIVVTATARGVPSYASVRSTKPTAAAAVVIVKVPFKVWTV
jgi:hypothetical protein